MSRTRTLWATTPSALLALTLASTPAMALEPSVEVVDFSGSPWAGHTTDLAQRGAALALTVDLEQGGWRVVGLYWSTDAGATAGWAADVVAAGADAPHLESQAAVCDGRAVVAYAVGVDAETRMILTHSNDLASPIEGERAWSRVGDIGRRPDVACVANSELAVAWFERIDDGYKVVLETGVVAGDDASPQRFSLGMGSPGRGLAVAATSDRVYVAWFHGSTLKLRRFRVGSTSARTLTSLGTTTIGTFSGGTTPKVGADGSKVVIAYTHGADLKVRRSTNRGVSFGSARTIRNLPDASEVGALATTVAMKGDLVALGTVDIGGIETLTGTGRGYKSTNGGSTFTRVTTHTGGRVLATVVRPGSSYRWAEAWDDSLSGDSPGDIRFRRE